jgi:hypothetical protein
MSGCFGTNAEPIILGFTAFAFLGASDGAQNISATYQSHDRTALEQPYWLDRLQRDSEGHRLASVGM